MKVPFTWKVTGWFMIGWSAEFPAADVRPLLEWNIVDQEWRFLTGWPDASSDDPDKMALRIHSHMFGLGGAISAFEGSSNHRLIFACTPIDDENSNMFYSIWWPKKPRRNLRHSSRRCPRACGETVPGHRLGRPRHLALPEVHRTAGAVEDRRETVYGASQVGDTVL